MKSTLAIKFTVSGLTGCLSHQEMMRLFQRAFVRVGLNLWFTKGFNPRPKMTMPLPRPVLVNSDDELLCVNIEQPEGELFDVAIASEDIQKQMPEGIDIKRVDYYEGKASFAPDVVEYVFSLGSSVSIESLQDKVECLSGQLEHLEEILVRRVNPAKKIDKLINAAEFMKSVELIGDRLVFRCLVKQNGSVRVEELMNLAGLKPEELAEPVLRKRVEWIKK